MTFCRHGVADQRRGSDSKIRRAGIPRFSTSIVGEILDREESFERVYPGTAQASCAHHTGSKVSEHSMAVTAVGYGLGLSPGLM